MFLAEIIVNGSLRFLQNNRSSLVDLREKGSANVTGLVLDQQGTYCALMTEGLYDIILGDDMVTAGFIFC